MNSRRRRRVFGFTLIEVMIAVVVLAVALGASLDALSRFSGMQAQLRERYLGHLVAWNVLTDHFNRLSSDGDTPDSPATQGAELQGNVEWQWYLKTVTFGFSDEEDEGDQQFPLSLFTADVYAPVREEEENARTSATLKAILK